MLLCSVSVALHAKLPEDASEDYCETKMMTL
jgi:hypothetical protein